MPGFMTTESASRSRLTMFSLLRNLHSNVDVVNTHTYEIMALIRSIFLYKLYRMMDSRYMMHSIVWFRYNRNVTA